MQDRKSLFSGTESHDNDTRTIPDHKQLNSINALYEDEHNGEYDDAPEIQEEDYDSDVPLAKRRHTHDEVVLDPRAGYRKATRVREREEGKRPRVADYEPDARLILLQAIPIFKPLVSSEDAYPDKLTEMIRAKQSWWEAADKLDIELGPNRECVKIVSPCLPAM